jgi:hypothetical protein
MAKPRKGRSKAFRIAGITAGVLAAVVAVAPTVLLQQRGWLVEQINRRSGLAPIRIDIAGLRGGWFQSFGLNGLRLIDDQGAELVKVGSVETELNLFTMMTNLRHLGTITVRDATLVVDVQPGTTNIEEAIKPLLQGGAQPPETASAGSGPGFTGRIRIADGVLQARDSVDTSAWELRVSEADIPMPTAEQPIPPMTLVGVLTQLSVLPGQAPESGQFTVRTEPIAAGLTTAPSTQMPSVRMTVLTQGLPLRWMGLVKRRLPDLPIEQVEGQATVVADVEYTGRNAMTAFVKTAQLDRLRVTAPSLLGQRGAGIEQIRLSGDVSLYQNRISTTGAKLECDFGTVVSKADIAIPSSADAKMPSLTHPWLADSEFDVQGEVDLPRLAAVAPDLLKTQDQVQLLSGRATVNLNQTRPNAPMLPNGASVPIAVAAPGSSAAGISGTGVPNLPSSNYKIQLGGLQADMQGRRIAWDQAFSAELDVSGNSQGMPSLRLLCNSEFCQIDGSGDLQDGRMTAQVDLDKMEQRLSEWFVLPMESLTGSAQAAVAWKLNDGNRLAASGSLRTTPLRIVHKNGRLEEPAWDGELSTVAQLDGTTLLQLDRLQASMKSEEESLVFQVLEPIAFGASAANSGRAPAPMILKLTGELQRWQRRGQLFAGIDPGISVGGKIALDVQGAIDTKHVELTQADWVSEPFQVASGETVFQESKMVGKFQGRFDSSDLAKLQVDQLLVRADSFAVQAQDQAAEGGVGRRGQAAFRIDPARMMTSVRVPAGSSGANRPAPSNPGAGLLVPNGGNGLQPGNTQPNSNAVAATVSANPPVRITGDVTGQLDWTLDPAQVQWHAVTQAKDLRAVQPALQRNPNQLVSTGGGNNPAETLLWEEPQAVVTVDGTYRFRDGDLQLTQVLAQTEWLAYGGMAAMSTEGQSTTVRSQGNLTYDAASVVQRLRPYTGGTLAASGQRSQPLEVTWTSTPGHKWTEALAARSSIGWDSANVVGIDIGGADIPLVIENGKFVSQAEFPVSQGMLRWNLDGDLVAEPMVIRQSQQRVIENVAITRQMCQGWLKFVAPLLADVTSVQGNLSLDIDRAEIYPTESVRQTVAGKVMVQGANVGPGPLADQILGLVMQIRNLRRGAGASDGGGQPTSWLTLPEQSIPFVVERGRVTHKDMRIAAGDVVVTTSGSVGLDGSLELVAGIPILKEWVDKTPALQPLAGQMIQIPVRGTVQRPQLDSSGLVQLAQQLATSALAGAAQKQIDKGLNKLLGPLSNQLAPLQQGVQQLPLPNLSIPGFGANPFAPNAGGATVPGVAPTGAPGVANPGAPGGGLPNLPLPNLPLPDFSGFNPLAPNPSVPNSGGPNPAAPN